MKDEISNILSGIRAYRDIQAGCCELIGKQDVINELQHLMCYREVRQHLSTLSELGLLHYAIGHIPENEINDIVYRLKGDYPESMILEAIEKVKNDQK